MSVAFSIDEHVDIAISRELKRRGVDVITAQEGGRRKVADPLLLDRAAELGRVFLTYDHDFLQEAALR
ncbi:MAG: DUF5615 family PIN-like protein [Armatimonadetes bacterium]|nr:DUF5615 family PIN-like protein [Armatimonadota bacterium]